MRDFNSIHTLCRICLNQGSRDIYENNFMTRNNIVSTNEIELDRIAEKLRYVTLLKVNPKENLPQQICDLCIVQLNVSYNFKRLALKNDFYIRQYMIENGMNLMKEDDEETALEIHQIHNVFRTSNRRPLILAPPPPPPQQQITTTTATTTTTISELRRNSTNSSVSGVSALIVNGCDSNNITSSSNTNGNENAVKRPFNVRPIQIKTEVIDPDYEDVTSGKQTVQSSPSNSSGSVSTILTVNSSSSGKSSASKRPKTPPMIVINGFLPYKSGNAEKSPVKRKSNDVSTPPRSSPRKGPQKQEKRPRNAVRDLRTIKKSNSSTSNLTEAQKKKKLKEAALRELEKKKKEKLKEQLRKEKLKKEQLKKKMAMKKGGNKNNLGRPKKQQQKTNPSKNKKVANGRGGGDGKRKS